MENSELVQGKRILTSKMAEQMQKVEQSLFDMLHMTNVMYNNDPSPNKISLSIGAYRDKNGKPYIFDVVQKAEQQLVKKLNKEYVQDGFEPFCQAAAKIIFGSDCQALKSQRIAVIQTLSGTGALSLGFRFIRQNLPQIPRTVYISDPSWATHPGIIEEAGLKVGTYAYYDPQIKSLNFNKMKESFSLIEKGSVVLFQTAGHNPTGCDLNQEQWKQICQIMKQRQLTPFFDPAYQGFASGDLDEDAWPIRYFLEQGFLMFVAQSFAKNLGLYGDRIGALHIITPSKEAAFRASTKIKSLARKVYLNPPTKGAFIVDKVLNNPESYKEWLIELKKVAESIKNSRKMLREELERLETPGNWKHITNQSGMFSFTGLTPRQCEIMMKKHHIYVVNNGRIAISCVVESNYKRIAQCMKLSILESMQQIRQQNQ